jgi:hypothetical protein
MGRISNLFSLGLFLLFLVGCSANRPASRSLVVSFTAQEANAFAGGAIVRVQNPSTGIYSDIELSSSPYSVSIADGTWNIYFVGFSGPGDWQGATNCGGSTGVNLASSTTAINILIAPAICAGAPYSTIIAKKIGVWDQSLWNQTKWGP